MGCTGAESEDYKIIEVLPQSDLNFEYDPISRLQIEQEQADYRLQLAYRDLRGQIEKNAGGM